MQDFPPRSDRFATGAGQYSSFRPAYPDDLMAWLAAGIDGAIPDRLAPIVDVGCGTGTFTRQLQLALRGSRPILGVEPSPAMRQAAIEESEGLDIRFVDGTAERLPVDDLSVATVTAATAAHWFDRPHFYAEVMRVLLPGGLLAIVEYVRATDQSAAAAAIEDFLRREGGPKAYARPDYEAELRALTDLRLHDTWSAPVTFALDLAGFVGLALSSSHAKPVVARHGEDKARAMLSEIGAGLADGEGRIPYIYRFQAFVARRA